jgi:DNA-binding LacI/PurR family transcriptional regulator
MKQLKKRITHQDVARLAGVSTAVVSYVINNGPRPTSPEVRERVLRAIEELDYHPNAFARGLRAQRSNTIGFVVNDYSPLDVFVSPYSAGILTGLTTYLKAQGYYVLIYPMSISESLSGIEVLLRSGRLDGIVIRLIQDPPATDALLELVAATQMACVCIERPGAARFGFSSVSYDDRHGAYAATRYLLEQGHRRIAHLSGDQQYLSASGRLEGYSKALAEQGLPVDEALVVGGDWDPRTVGASVARLLALDAPPSAIFAANDSLAFAAIEELRARRYAVPEDVAVVGFDDIELASQIAPPLTTVRIPLHQIGQRAGELLLGSIQAELTDARVELVPTELIRRASA